ncbi:ATP-dependent (S)-NAD(P)H-hydrate dehydratase [Novipirellula aureliae]|uniref:ADP-dependent (S)-NAD(P)H-hydrate dehydratase n=1 Tax=Novipirellula aureliae TaxID=2527966 RepID=A0A5C6E8V9_9BACT|nr:NAD(P)H-hydrate dehydratase [Novipirellula aureliae]TWU43896.1 ATP-dependent (S)-NAD(P)H-hydrate dehydratase [Novipirellula aureliae]
MTNPPLPFPSRKTDAHKGDVGRVLLVGGSRGMAGSISLSSMAALHTGSGLVSAAVPDRCLETVASFHPCLMTIPLADDAAGHFASAAVTEIAQQVDAYDAIGCGPGMGTSDAAIELVELLLQKSDIARVLDADALNALSKTNWGHRQSSKSGPLILTPHPGELQRLSGVRSSDREQQIKAAHRLAALHDVVVVVKGGPTVVVDAERKWTNTTGNPGMATGGSGDVLTGVVTSLLGQGMTPWDASRLGVWLHGAAGDRAAVKHGQAGMTARELLDEIPGVMAAYENRCI